MRLRPFLVRLFLSLPVCALASGQNLRLDKLSDCNSLASIQTVLQQPVSHSCRVASNKLEERLMSGFQRTPRLIACLLVAPPVPRLAKFSCIDLDFGGPRELLCFRLIDSRAVQNFQDNYDHLQANRYKVAAASCPVTNHDATEAPSGLFPLSLSAVAKVRFGFVVGIGEARIPRAAAYHGFGDVAPDLANSGSALEVFDMFQYKAGQMNQALSDLSDSIGDWRFDINDMLKESQRDFARPFEQASGKRFGVRMRLITITSIHSSNIPFQDRASRLDNWQQAISDDLKSEGFRDLTPEELANTPFKDPDAIRNFIAKNAPYGNSALMNRSLGPHLVLLVDDDDEEDCYKVAEVIVSEAEDGVKNDHGGFGLNFFTIGRCGTVGGPDKWLDKIVQRETKILEDEVTQP